MIKGIIYDLDDLMVNSNPLHIKAWEILLKRYGHKFSDLPEKFKSDYIGMRVIDILKDIVKYLKLDVDIQVFRGERENIFLDLIKKELEPMPGLNKTLNLFKQHQYQLALASSGTKKYINLVLAKFNISDFFNVIISGDDVKNGKPDPETYILASNKLGLSPNECLVLEDATKGIEAAKQSGCACFAIKNLNTPPQDRSRADKILDSLENIKIEMIKEL